jgi:flagellar hook-associated protein 3 FlgL
MYSGTRVTHRSVTQQALVGLEQSQTRLSRLQERLSTGKQVSRPSDDPSATASALGLRAEMARTAQWSRNADDAIGYLGTLDSTLTGMNDQVQRARDLVLQGMSTGASSQESREAMAAEIDGLRGSLIGSANTTYGGRPVFGGTTPGATAYDPTTGAYVGDAHPVTRTVGSQVRARVDITGPEAFGPPGSDLFSVLQSISTHLRTDPTQLGTDLTALDGASRNLITKQADVGVRYNRVDQMRTAADNRVLDLQNSLSSVEDVDLARTILDLNLQKATYQAALQSTAQVVQPSLMDFLR